MTTVNCDIKWTLLVKDNLQWKQMEVCSFGSAQTLLNDLKSGTQQLNSKKNAVFQTDWKIQKLWRVEESRFFLWLTLAFSKSRSLPMVVSNLQRHSKDSSSWFFNSLTTQSCIIASVSILSLNSSPMNLMLPIERRRALSLASSSSSWSLSRSVVWRKWNRYLSNWKRPGETWTCSFLHLIPTQLSPAPSASSQTRHRLPCLFQTPSGSGWGAVCESSLTRWVFLSWALWATKYL